MFLDTAAVKEEETLSRVQTEEPADHYYLYAGWSRGPAGPHDSRLVPCQLHV